MDLLEAFHAFDYPAAIGPCVYDIQSPGVPGSGEIAGLLRLALQALRPDQLWVTPDCGLKTRDWDQIRPALQYMVAAARQLRAELASS